MCSQFHNKMLYTSLNINISSFSSFYFFFSLPCFCNFTISILIIQKCHFLDFLDGFRV